MVFSYMRSVLIDVILDQRERNHLYISLVVEHKMTRLDVSVYVIELVKVLDAFEHLLAQLCDGINLVVLLA